MAAEGGFVKIFYLCRTLPTDRRSRFPVFDWKNQPTGKVIGRSKFIYVIAE